MLSCRPTIATTILPVKSAATSVGPTQTLAFYVSPSTSSNLPILPGLAQILPNGAVRRLSVTMRGATRPCALAGFGVFSSCFYQLHLPANDPPQRLVCEYPDIVERIKRRGDERMRSRAYTAETPGRPLVTRRAAIIAE